MKLNDAINITFGSTNAVAVYFNSELIWPTANASILTSNLIMHLDASNTSSYPGTGTTWTDLSGNGNNGTIDGATWSSTDDGIFDFDGTNDTVQVAHNSSLSLSTSVSRTIQVWFKTDVIPALNAQVPVFGKLSSSFNFDGYWGGLFSNGGQVRFVTNGTSTQRISTSTSTISVNTWYLFTAISRITGTTGSTKVYIDNTEYISAAHGTDGYSESNPFYLGYIGSGVSSNYLNGKIGACYFYNRDLSTAEIAQNYDATKTRYGKT